MDTCVHADKSCVEASLDCIVVTVELVGQNHSGECLRELSFEQDTVDPTGPVEQALSKEHLGQRQPHLIKVETYKPSDMEKPLPSDKMAEAMVLYPDKIPFFSGIPAVESVKGLLHLYRDSCPVCRYVQTPEPTGDNMCFSCDSKEDLWICLICGHIGCGRYVGGHANNHFVETQHTFTMQLGSQRVWDYVGDNYVHRLVQNKDDGKLVEVPGHGADTFSEEKMDSLQLEYTYLMTAQLESQRLFFEEKLARVEKESNEQLAVMEKRCKEAVVAREHLADKMTELERERKASDKRNGEMLLRIGKLGSELEEEKELNKCLTGNQQRWKERLEVVEHKLHSTVEHKDHEIQDLKEQVGDLMFYLQTQKKIEESSEETRQEIQDGRVVVAKKPSAMNPSSAGKKPRRKK